MHSPEYTQKIKALLIARKDMEDSLARCIYAYRNGRKPSVIELGLAKDAFKEAMEILETQQDT